MENLKKIKGDASFRKFYRKNNNGYNSIVVLSKREKLKNLLIYDAINKVLIKNREILIAVKDGFLKCNILQFPNRKRMSALDILNGHTFSSEIEVN